LGGLVLVGGGADAEGVNLEAGSAQQRLAEGRGEVGVPFLAFWVVDAEDGEADVDEAAGAQGHSDADVGAVALGLPIDALD
jgi:hypothetical protein